MVTATKTALMGRIEGFGLPNPCSQAQSLFNNYQIVLNEICPAIQVAKFFQIFDTLIEKFAVLCLGSYPARLHDCHDIELDCVLVLTLAIVLSASLSSQTKGIGSGIICDGIASVKLPHLTRFNAG